VDMWFDLRMPAGGCSRLVGDNSTDWMQQPQSVYMHCLPALLELAAAAWTRWNMFRCLISLCLPHQEARVHTSNERMYCSSFAFC
jgi:hypothetical protein